MTTRTVVEFAKHGPSSVLQLRTDAPLPPRKKKEVLVDNRATSVNPLDYKASVCACIGGMARERVW